MIASIVSALLLIWFVLDPYGASWAYFAMGITGLIGAITGFISRRNGPHVTNSIGLYLGIVMAVAFAVLFFYLSSTNVEPTRFN
jgi:uncharacterized membrane protein